MIESIKQKMVSFLSDEFISHTAIVFLGTVFIGSTNFLYHLIAVRMLFPEDYGIFNALISLVMISTMLINPLGMAFTRFLSECITKNKLYATYGIFVKFIKRLFIIACLVFLLFLITSSFIAKFLKTQLSFIILCGGIIALSLFSGIFLSLLQGFQRFINYSIVWASSSLAKFILGTLFMYFAWGIYGSLIGFLIEPVLIICLSLFLLSFIFRKEKMIISKKNSTAINLSSVYKSFFPIFLARLSFVSLSNIDIILVKHFFLPLDAGCYAIAQMMGKVIFSLTSALAIVILPKSTAAFINNRSSLKLLYRSLLLGGVCCFLISGFTFLFPDTIIKILAGKTNPISSSLIGLLSLAMAFYALLWIVINFSLAINNLKFILPLFIMAILAATFIYACHHTLKVVVLIVLTFSIISFFVTLERSLQA